MEVVNRIVADQEDAVVRSLAADKGYFAVEEIGAAASASAGR